MVRQAEVWLKVEPSQHAALPRIISAKSAGDKIANTLMEMRTPAPSRNLYDIHENSIPFPHRDLAAAYFTSLSLLYRETC